MIIYKFGGASLKDAEGFRRIAEIIKSCKSSQLLVVVSATGKTTNLLESVYRSIQEGQIPASELSQFSVVHQSIADELNLDRDQTVRDIGISIQTIQESIKFEGSSDALYDLIVSQGEMISSLLVHRFLLSQSCSNIWLDARQLVQTDDHHREGNVQWNITENKIRRSISDHSGIFLTQGFIGSTQTGKTTTLGRDGSDYSAAIFASSLQAKSVTIWKDVPGVMNADPKRIPDAVVFPELPYKEAAEMTYYGASVIHPKTIRPLANRDIPLWVKSFIDPTLPGTLIHDCKIDRLPPLVVFKENQCLISCKGIDYSFITENQLSEIFASISSSGVRINVMQNSAISFSFCVDYRDSKVHPLIERLSRSFEVYYNTGLTLITVKNYTPEIFEQYRKQTGVLIEQSSRSTLQILVR